LARSPGRFLAEHAFESLDHHRACTIQREPTLF
jgi:hypothetical protein